MKNIAEIIAIRLPSRPGQISRHHRNGRSDETQIGIVELLAGMILTDLQQAAYRHLVVGQFEVEGQLVAEHLAVRLIEFIQRLAARDVVMQRRPMLAKLVVCIGQIIDFDVIRQRQVEIAVQHVDVVGVEFVVYGLGQCLLKAGGLLAEQRTRLVIAH